MRQPSNYAFRKSERKPVRISISVKILTLRNNTTESSLFFRKARAVAKWRSKAHRNKRIAALHIFGTLDLAGAITLATVYQAPVYMGPAYWIPAFWVPALLAPSSF